MKRFAELSAAQKAIEIVRWICVLPAAIFTSRLPGFLFSFVMPPALAQPPGTPQPPPPSELQRMLLSLLAALLVSIGFVLVGSLVAPRHRRHVAIILAILIALHAFLYHILIHLPGTPHYTSFAAATLAAIASVWLVYWFDTDTVELSRQFACAGRMHAYREKIR
jgi:hypothetical protein